MVQPIPIDKDTYNKMHCNYLYGGYYYGEETEEGFHAWESAYSETWGPPYDATSKLWDMTHGAMAGG